MHDPDPAVHGRLLLAGHCRSRKEATTEQQKQSPPALDPPWFRPKLNDRAENWDGGLRGR
jgi:hypothetical protein